MAAPILDPPVATPILIDPGVTYFYVVSQEGGDSVEVSDVIDMTIVPYFGSPIVLAVKFTGDVPADPILKDVEFDVINAEGTTSQTLQFKVGSNTQRRIPNITTAAHSTVTASAAVSIPMSADVPAIFIGSTGLPASLHLTGNSFTGSDYAVTGTAPAATGTYLVRLTAKTTGNGAIAYNRYWVLVVEAAAPGGGVNDGGGSSGSNLDFTPGTAPAIHVLYDGDYTVAQQAGSPIPVNPIEKDPKPYVYRIKYWQFLKNYQQPEPGSAGPNGGYYVGDVPGSFHDIGGGVVEFVREFALVPDSRNEFESFTYSYQMTQFESGNWSMAEYPDTTLSRVQYDYFHLTSVPSHLSGIVAPTGAGGGAPPSTNGNLSWMGLDPRGRILFNASHLSGGSIIDRFLAAGRDASGQIADIDLPKAPRAVQMFNFMYYTNGWGALAPGSEILAEDATLRQWKGLIFERKQRFVVILDFGQTING